MSSTIIWKSTAADNEVEDIKHTKRRKQRENIVNGVLQYATTRCMSLRPSAVTHMPTVPKLGVSNEERTLTAPWGYRFSTYLEDYRPYTIARPEKLRLDPLAVDGVDRRRRGKREKGEEIISTTLNLVIENVRVSA